MLNAAQTDPDAALSPKNLQAKQTRERSCVLLYLRGYVDGSVLQL